MSRPCGHNMGTITNEGFVRCLVCGEKELDADGRPIPRLSWHERALAQAIADARAAGYAEAKEQAAKVADDQCETHWEAARQCSAEGDSKGDIQQMKCGRTCEIIGTRIRALAPATTTKEPT